MNLNEELFRCIKAGDKHRVKELIQLGADVDFLYGMQGTPLCAAISANQLDITRFLIETKCDVNTKDVDGEPPLCLAIRKQHSNVIKLLLNTASCDVNKKDPVTGNPPICIATNHHDMETVKLLIRAKCDVNATGSSQTTALHQAIAHRQVEILQELLEEASCNVNTYNYNGQSPIHTAASLNTHPQVLRTLLASCQHAHKDENPHVLNVDRPCVMEKSTALHYAIKYKNLNGVRLLLEAGCDINKSNVRDQQPLFIAASENDTEVLKLLLQKNANPNIERRQTKNLPTKNDEWKTSPLHVSIGYGNMAAVAALVEARADLNYQSDKGKKPLMRALDLNRTEIVDLKVGPVEGLDVSKEDSTGNTALFSVCNCTHAGYFAQKLINFGCAVNHFNRKQETPLCVAVGLRCVDVTTVLLDNGAITEVYHDGCTPLQYTAYEDASHIAALLVYHGAELNSTSDTLPPKSALEIAFENGSSRVAQILMMCGCDFTKLRDHIISKKKKNWFNVFARHPQKLSVLCRNAIRHRIKIGGMRPSEIHKLPVPSKIISFLMLDDILSDFLCEDEQETANSFASLSTEESESASSHSSFENSSDSDAVKGKYCL